MICFILLIPLLTVCTVSTICYIAHGCNRGKRIIIKKPTVETVRNGCVLKYTIISMVPIFEETERKPFYSGKMAYF